MKGLQDIELEKRAPLLNLHSLSSRMDKGDMLLVTSRLRGHSLKLRKDRSRLDLRKFTFKHMVVNMWNDLPADAAKASSVRPLKNKLEAHLKNLPRRSPE